MTRVVPKRAVWTWECDRCHRREHLAWDSQGLPTADEMRAAGWSISPGVPVRDLCPECVEAERQPEAYPWDSVQDMLSRPDRTQPPGTMRQ